MNSDEILAQLKPLGSESIKRVLVKHGAKEPFWGVKITDLKKFQKKIKTNHQLALDLYDTGVSDAMYLAGLIADDAKMTKKNLQRWAKAAPWSLISECTVAWVAAESNHGRELALEWIDSPKESIACSGWCTLGSLVSIKADDELDLGELKKLLKRVEKTVRDQPNRVRYCMGSFLLCVAAYVKDLTDFAIATAKRIGRIEVDVGETDCKVPYAPEYIEKIKKRGAIGKIRKTVKC
jgi:3-methyladenine DNA glycosylase AlkD